MQMEEMLRGPGQDDEARPERCDKQYHVFVEGSWVCTDSAIKRDCLLFFRSIRATFGRVQ